MSDPGPQRQRLRDARRALGETERRAAARRALSRIAALPRYLNARRLALYVGVDGELCPLPLAEEALRRGKSVYLPVLDPLRDGRLLFCRWRPGEPMRRNRFGIAEPVPTAKGLIRATHLDLVVVPLLGFDAQGHRIGMGGGYYDRTFAFRQHRRHWKTPYLVGLAHEVQRLAAITPQPWDVRLDVIATDVTLQRARQVTAN